MTNNFCCTWRPMSLLYPRTGIPKHKWANDECELLWSRVLWHEIVRAERWRPPPIALDEMAKLPPGRSIWYGRMCGTVLWCESDAARLSAARQPTFTRRVAFICIARDFACKYIDIVLKCCVLLPCCCWIFMAVWIGIIFICDGNCLEMRGWFTL